VEGKEIKRYKNIEIPDDLKKLEYQDFKLDVPLNGAITFKIMFEPDVLPEEFPQTRERKTRQSMPQGTEPQATAEAGKATPQEAQPADALPAETTEAPAEAVADGEAITAEIIGDEAAAQEPAITAEPENTEAIAQPEGDAPARKPASKGKGKKIAAPTDSADK